MASPLHSMQHLRITLFCLGEPSTRPVLPLPALCLDHWFKSVSCLLVLLNSMSLNVHVDPTTFFFVIYREDAMDPDVRRGRKKNTSSTAGPGKESWFLYIHVAQSIKPTSDTHLWWAYVSLFLRLLGQPTRQKNKCPAEGSVVRLSHAAPYVTCRHVRTYSM